MRVARSRRSPAWQVPARSGTLRGTAFDSRARARGLSQPPIDDIEECWTPAEKAHVSRSVVGPPATVRRGIEALVAETGADELIIVSDIYDHAARLRSFELIADAASR